MTLGEFCRKVLRRIWLLVISLLSRGRRLFRRFWGRESLRRMNLRRNGPKVSIVIPVYNGADFLEDAIESALRQTYTNIEIIVVNDGSTDNGETAEIISRYGGQVIAIEKENGGCASALNAGIERATGDFISWLSHDDLYEKTKIEDQVPMAVGSGTDKRIVFSDFSVINGKGQAKLLRRNKSEKPALYPLWSESPLVPRFLKFKEIVLMPPVREEGFRYWLTEENCLNGCTLLIPRRAFVDHGGFDEKLKTTQDYAKWFQLAADYEFCYQPGLLVKARVHDQQCTVQMSTVVESEINDLLSNFCRKLDDSEIEAAGNGSVRDGFLRLKRSFERRGFNGAAKEVDNILEEKNLI